MHKGVWLPAAGLLLLLLLSAGCATGLTPATPEGEWRLVRFAAAADTMAHEPIGAAFTLNLNGAGEASGQVACNRFRGRYRIAAQSLQLEALAVTRAFCSMAHEPTQQLERQYLARLQSAPEFRLREDGLELAFADGARWRFVRP